MRSKNALKNIISSLLLQLITIICGFIVPKMIISTYGSATNGLINSIVQFLGYITLLESGFGPVVKSLLYKPIAQKNRSQIEEILYSTERFFRNIAKIFIVYILVLVIVYPVMINKQFDTIYTISLIIIISISTFAEYFFGITYKLYLQSEQKTYVTSYIQLGATFINTILIVILIKTNCSIQLVKLVSSLIFVLKPIIQNYYIKKKYNLNLKNAKGSFVIKQKWDGLVQHIAAVIHGNTDIAILTIFSTMEEISVYSVYLLIINGVKKIINAFNDGIDASFGDMIAKNENLNKSFSTYEFFYHTISTITFTCTIILITPFVEVYTSGVNDVNYIRPLFGLFLTLAEYMWSIRLPYSSIVLAAGHFKETKKGAWVEAVTNIVISIILVFKFGIIGVAIGTLIAMTIRTIEFMYHTSKYILNRNQIKSFIWLALVIAETSVCIIISNFLYPKGMGNYTEWFKYAIIIFIIAVIVVLPTNMLIFKNERKNLKELINYVLKKGNK